MVAAVGLGQMLASLAGDLLRLPELVGSEATRECDRIFCVISTRRFREAYAMESQQDLRCLEDALDDATCKFSEPQQKQIAVLFRVWAKRWVQKCGARRAARALMGSL